MPSATLYVTLWLLAGFLAGSVPFGWIVARLGGLNIREHGSGNIGMTNVWRVMGWRAGVTVLILDLLKGFVPVLASELWLQNDKHSAAAISSSWLAMGVGLAAILGHTFTPWLRFRGGKGVATGLGVLIALFKLWSLVPIAIFGLTLALSRYVSLASLVSAASLVVISFAVPALRQYLLFGLLGPVLIVVTHRSNIKRLLAGTENRVGRKKD